MNTCKVCSLAKGYIHIYAYAWHNGGVLHLGLWIPKELQMGSRVCELIKILRNAKCHLYVSWEIVYEKDPWLSAV